MLSALADVLPGLARGVWTARAACSGSRLLSNLAASTSQQQGGLPFALPEHEIEDGLPVVTARLRHKDGTIFCTKLRRGGRTPAVLHSLPGERHLLLEMETKEAAAHVRNFGRNGIKARVMRLELRGDGGELLGGVRVLPKEVHMNSSTLEVQHLRLLYLPRSRRVRVDVPVALWGEDAAPGLRSGGWLHVVNRTVPLVCEGGAVPPRIELDVRHMNAKDVIRYSDVPAPPGCTLRVRDPSQPVVRCAAKVGGE